MVNIPASVTLNLATYRYRSWSSDDRAQFVRAYIKAIGANGRESPTGRVLCDIGSALSPSTADTVDIDLTGVDRPALGSVVRMLDSFGQIAPKENPPMFLREFADILRQYA